MDENAWRAKRATINTRPCVFENAVLARCVRCALAAHQAIAERESIFCTDESSHARCAAFADHLRAAAGFAIRAPDPSTTLSHAQKVRLACGGLLGLQAQLDVAREQPSVERLLAEAQARWGDLQALPYGDLVRAIARWRGRPRSRNT